MSSKYDMIYDAMIYGECEPDPPEEFSSCPKCSGELIPRKGRYGLFYGCKNYPKCKFTCSKDEYNEKGETEQNRNTKQNGNLVQSMNMRIVRIVDISNGQTGTHIEMLRIILESSTKHINFARNADLK